MNEHIDTLEAQAAAALRKDLTLLGLRALRSPVDVLYFDDREDLRPLTGLAPKGIALPERNTLLIVANDSTRAYHAHELMHLVAIDAWGRAAAPADALQEGLSVLADSPCAGYELYSIAAFHLHRGTLLPSDTLITHFRELPDMVAYMQAGALVQYLIERFGQQRFKTLWTTGWAGLAAIDHLDAVTLDRDYRTFLLQRFPQSPAVNWERLLKNGCG